MDLDRVEVQLKAGLVKRYHTTSIIGEQTVGTHSYGVAQIVRALTSEKCSAALLKAALDHDVPELFIGDAPHPIKVDNPELKKALKNAEKTITASYGLDHNLTAIEKLVLKQADLIEMGFFALHQLELGSNIYALEVMKNVITALENVEGLSFNGLTFLELFKRAYNESK